MAEIQNRLIINVTNNTGIGKDTKITDAETGEIIGHAKGIVIKASVGGIVTAEIDFCIPKFNVNAVASLSEKTKQELRDLKALLERIDGKN